MNDESRILELLEEVLDSHLAPEEVCIECPELLSSLKNRLRRFRDMDAHLKELFPSSRPGAEKRRSGHVLSQLPEIPGYDVQAILGRGGIGIVYLALHLTLRRPVALKMLLSGEYASALELTRFMREAQSVAALRHPNIVQVHDVGDLDGRPFYTMELIEGGTLAQTLAGVPRSAGEAAAMARTLARATHVAHQAGIVHRDLKPANVLLTADGIPKITDFGLARQLKENTSLTRTGARLGTPSYMSPEQAGATADAICAPVDIYSLGAILYEMLTGRPPFTAETAAETERQVIFAEPVQPSRLNAQVPRDLENICLKCLNKLPNRRYATAADLADDLDRFLRDEPVLARATGWIERTIKWMRRHPALAVAFVGAILLSLLLSCGGAWVALQRVNLAHAVQADLKEVTVLQQQARWPEARIALDGAGARLGGGGSDALRRQIVQASHELDLVIALDEIRMSHATSGSLVIYRQKANANYAKNFAQTGLGTFSDAPRNVAARVNASAVRPALLAALDDWVFCATDQSQQKWVLEVARAVEPDPSGWNSRILDPANWENSTAMVELAHDVPVETASLPLLLALGQRLVDSDLDAAPYLRRIQQQHPDDFWANLALGNALLIRAPNVACGYYRAALASRPELCVGYCAVGDSLRLTGATDEAIHYYRKALDLETNYARGYSNLGLAYRDQHDLDKAIECYRRSIELDPQYAWSYYNLANALYAQGKLDQAAVEYQNAIAVDPSNPEALGAIRSLLVRQGRSNEVWAAWHKIIETDPPRFDEWWGYAELTLFLGKEQEYRSVRQALLKRFGDRTDPMITEKIGKACLMLPGSDDETRMATALIDRAISARGTVDESLYPYFIYAKGLAEYRQGRMESAMAIMQGDATKVLGPAPKLVVAMAQYRRGDVEKARKTLAVAIASFNWSLSDATSRDVWFYHVLRREAEAMILPNQH